MVSRLSLRNATKEGTRKGMARDSMHSAPRRGVEGAVVEEVRLIDVKDELGPSNLTFREMNLADLRAVLEFARNNSVCKRKDRECFPRSFRWCCITIIYKRR